MERCYFCIDMKSFFASVECAERSLNSLDTNLVVADPDRGGGAICLAVSPKLKSLGVKNRCRLFEIPKDIDCIIAKPRMKKYIEYTADIYEIYLKYFSKEDIHVYSIDESFIDVTDYLKLYKIRPKQLAKKLIEEIAVKKGVPSTCGIGTNMFLAKIALDITAKNSTDHISYLNEDIFKEYVWHHKPITDIWQISRGTAKRLLKYGVTDLKGVTEMKEEILYKEFGINAELLIDHAWGREPCLMEDIKAYKGKSRSISNSQILFEDYNFNNARIVFEEMVQSLCYEMLNRNVISKSAFFSVGYSKDVKSPDGGAVKLTEATNLFSVIITSMLDAFDKSVSKFYPIRKISMGFSIADSSYEGYDVFIDIDKLNKEKDTEKAVLEIKQKYGKNAMLKGISYQEGATSKLRNKLVGGHNGE
ncbi:MAG: DNA repair protein [Clostridia bacterium]|nr:DNA repair protein [Clostridia bacterium]